MNAAIETLSDPAATEAERIAAARELRDWLKFECGASTREQIEATIAAELGDGLAATIVGRDDNEDSQREPTR